MPRRKDPESYAKEARIQTALVGIANGQYPSVNHAARECGVPPSTLHHHLNGRQTRVESHEDQQLLSANEEKEIVRWITHATATGYPPRHATLRSMATEIQRRCVCQINDDSIEHVSYPEIGTEWVKRFLTRHPELKSKVGKSIDAARVTDASPEILTKWLEEYNRVVTEYDIETENTYNMDETGFSIGKIEATHIIINSKIREAYQAQPGRQEWVSIIECICADGSAISPLVIFKGENLSQTWIPGNIYEDSNDWKITCNSKGWTSNEHGLKWLRLCFEPCTREKAGGKMRLLILDGHDSHTYSTFFELLIGSTGNFIGHCIINNIILMLLPPHTSHLTQPLDVAVFGPLKKAMAAQCHELIFTEVSRIQKAEWLEAYVKARRRAFSASNILSAFRGAGLVPYCPSKVLNQVRTTSPSTPAPPPHEPQSPMQESTPLSNPLLTSSPVDITAFRAANQELMRLISSKEPLNTPARTHIRRATNATERVFMRCNIVQRGLDAATQVLSARKMRASGKRGILKGKHVLSVAEIHTGVLEAEAQTRRRKVPKAPRAPRADPLIGPAILGNSLDAEESSKDEELEVMDCIIVTD